MVDRDALCLKNVMSYEYKPRNKQVDEQSETIMLEVSKRFRT